MNIRSAFTAFALAAFVAVPFLVPNRASASPTAPPGLESVVAANAQAHLTAMSAFGAFRADALLTPNTATRLRVCKFDEPDPLRPTGWGFTHVSPPLFATGTVIAFFPPIGPWTQGEAYAAMQGYATKTGVEIGEDGLLLWAPPRHSTEGTELLFNIFGPGDWPYDGEE